MQVKNFGNTDIAGTDLAAADRQVALRVIHRVKLSATLRLGYGRGSGDKRSGFGGHVSPNLLTPL